jgi:predicted HTH transcriptional regulator
MRKINLAAKQIKTLKVRHKVCQVCQVCREQKECERIKAILLQNKDWSLTRIAEALLIYEKSIKRYIDDYLDKDKLKSINGGSNSYLNDEQTQRLIQHLCDVT